jgi:hypothetical protein
MNFYGIGHDELDKHIKGLEASGKFADKISVSQSLKHYVRDWTETGEAERKVTFSCLIKTLEGLFPERDGEKPVKVLVPGAGLGRLGHDIARLGGKLYRCSIVSGIRCLLSSGCVTDFTTYRLRCNHKRMVHVHERRIPLP